MRYFLMSMGCVAALLLLPAPDLARGGTSVECGYVVQQMCPGCMPATPADGTCFCGDNVDACDCMKQSGGIQNGTVIHCYTDNFGKNSDPDGYVLSVATPNAPCKDVKRCRHGEGDGVGYNCGNWQDPGCEVTDECSWKKQSSSTTAPVYTQGARCEDGVPQ